MAENRKSHTMKIVYDKGFSNKFKDIWHYIAKDSKNNANKFKKELKLDIENILISLINIENQYGLMIRIFVILFLKVTLFHTLFRQTKLLFLIFSNGLKTRVYL